MYTACHVRSITFIALHQSFACCNAHLCPHHTMHQHCPAKLAQPSHLWFKLHAICCMSRIQHHNCLAAYAAFAGLDQFSHLSLAITIMPSAVQRSAVQCRYKCSAVQCAALHCTVCQAQAGSTARQQGCLHFQQQTAKCMSCTEHHLHSTASVVCML